MKIHKELGVEELLLLKPAANRYLMTKNIRCIACGEPVWGTLGELLDEQNYSAEDQEQILIEINELK